MPEELADYVEKIERELSSLLIKCKFVERENLHICLSFLGELDDCKIKDICENLDSVCKEFPKFEVTIGSIKIIPNENYIRVLALDIVDKIGNIQRIAKEIQKAVGGDSHPAHLTLCRIKSITDKQSTTQKIKSIKTLQLPLPISSVHLIKSELKETGPAYSSVHESKLR